jgi:hypothetical protein
VAGKVPGQATVVAATAFSDQQTLIAAIAGAQNAVLVIAFMVLRRGYGGLQLKATGETDRAPLTRGPNV